MVSVSENERLNRLNLLSPDAHHDDDLNIDDYLASFPYFTEPDTEMIVCYAGVRGGGKSLGAAYMALIDFLIRGKQVWSNIPIEVTLKRHGETRYFVAEEFDSGMLYSFDDSLRGGMIFIDEANYYIDSRRSSSNRNILFVDIAQQIRKRALSLIFTVQFEMWLETRVRQMMDICIQCKDLARTEWGYDEGVDKGTEFEWKVQDWSGALSGESYWQTGSVTEWVFYGKPVWDIYKSYGIVDIWEARQAIKINQEAMEVTVGVGKNRKIEERKQRFGDVGGVLAALVNRGVTEISNAELYEQFDIDPKDRAAKNAIGGLVKNFGCRNINRNRWRNVGSEGYSIPEHLGETPVEG